MLLSTLGIEGRVDHLPSELSGGEQQRAAIAEVLMGGATIVVADEPTAELDSTSASHVMDTMVELARAGVTFVVATHDRSVMRRADAALELDHGIRRSAASVPADAADRSSVAALRTAPSDVAEPDRADRWRPPAAAAAAEPEPERAFVLDANALSKTYRRGDEVVHALDDVSLTLRAGELVGLVGRSGSGKTTLLNVIAGWEHADAGTMELSGARSATPGWDELAVVPQKLGLFDELSVRENLEYPARLHGRLEELRGRVDELMEDLGIAHLAARYPKETSLGEQQRTAIARALVLSPTLVLADEPTGHQDAVVGAARARGVRPRGRRGRELPDRHPQRVARPAAGPRARDGRRAPRARRRSVEWRSERTGRPQKIWPGSPPPVRCQRRSCGR